MRSLWVVGLLASLTACASRDAPAETRGALEESEPAPAEPQAEQPSTRGPTRAALEADRGIAQPEPPAPAAPPAASDIRIELSAIDAARGEDGRGAVVAASAPIAIDLVRDTGFPGRARDPVLHVGQLRFERYSHPAPDRMRFVVADRAALPEGAEVTLVWGDDRVVVTGSLEVPR